MGADNMEKVLISDSFVFESDDYSSYEGSRKGVLRTVRGPLAEWDNKNRNKRKYSERLWDRVLNSPYVKEQMKNKSLFGEANHPPDRMEVDFSRVSHCISDMRKEKDKKQIYGNIDILDTPLGRVLNALYEYGAVLGASSRAGGTLTEKTGYTEVDEDNYQFITFDIVPYPSVESARMVSEGASVEEIDVRREQVGEQAKIEIKRIFESSSESDKGILKEFIGELSSIYDMGSEIDKMVSIIEEEVCKEEEEIEEGRDGEKIKDATLCLLKDSYRLNRSINEEREGLKKELEKLKESMLKKDDEIKSLKESIDSEFHGSGLDKSTISKIKDMETEIELLEAENKMLLNKSKAFKLVNERVRELEGEKKGLEFKLREKDQKVLESSKNIKESLEVEKELGKVVEELATVKKEKEDLERVVEGHALEKEKTEKRVGNMEGREKILEGKNRKMAKEFSELKESLKRSEKEKRGKIAAAQLKIKSIEESFEAKIKSIEEENSSKIEEYEKLIGESLERVNETEKQLEEIRETAASYQKICKSYEKGLIEVVSGMYGVNESEVRARLGEGKRVKVGDLYVICEEIAARTRPSNLVEAVVERSTVIEGEDRKESKLGSVVSGSRRGK